MAGGEDRRFSGVAGGVGYRSLAVAALLGVLCVRHPVQSRDL
ncbi:hypothetical protein SBA4_550021 [Candidatus Sulfopaludibacter sp. SbA4]|nr:hypothetical protein SBA4_550021 [Candidatus Sulfopaludibacter sp. SbA4]